MRDRLRVPTQDRHSRLPRYGALTPTPSLCCPFRKFQNSKTRQAGRKGIHLKESHCRQHIPTGHHQVSGKQLENHSGKSLSLKGISCGPEWLDSVHSMRVLQEEQAIPGKQGALQNEAFLRPFVHSFTHTCEDPRCQLPRPSTCSPGMTDCSLMHHLRAGPRSTLGQRSQLVCDCCGHTF